ncbi:MAG: class I SAM-dependent methyltransferase [Alphaproteobacteria bacterium]|nr:class I SAM-dependent methyltransferase [Alphaproteobacteria bacterium]
MTETASLGPSKVLAAWREVEAGRMSREAFHATEAEALAGYKRGWTEAIAGSAAGDLETAILEEIGAWRKEPDLEKVRARCERSLARLKDKWNADVGREAASEQVVAYYDSADDLIEELMWWHALGDDTSPLAYAAALDFARANGLRHLLDFGSGVGASAILFHRHTDTVTLADVSSTLLEFCRWRLERRRVPAAFLDLKTLGLPKARFDLVTAMDVFEHLEDPAKAVSDLDAALKPGGYVLGRFAADPEDDDRPQHIVHDFQPVFRRLAELGYREAWKDQWFWGHQAFQKPA